MLSFEQINARRLVQRPSEIDPSRYLFVVDLSIDDAYPKPPIVAVIGKLAVPKDRVKIGFSNIIELPDVLKTPPHYEGYVRHYEPGKSQESDQPTGPNSPVQEAVYILTGPAVEKIRVLRRQEARKPVPAANKPIDLLFGPDRYLFFEAHNPPFKN